MSDEYNGLCNEFPELKSKIHDLKLSNAHFRKLFEEYGVICKTLHREEQRIELMTELESEALKKKRLHLKDELYTILRK